MEKTQDETEEPYVVLPKHFSEGDVDDLTYSVLDEMDPYDPATTKTNALVNCYFNCFAVSKMHNKNTISVVNSKWISLSLILVVHLFKKFKAYSTIGYYKGSYKINVPVTSI